MRFGIQEGSEPAHELAGAVILAGACLAEQRLGGIEIGQPGGAVIDRPAHADFDIVDAVGSQIQRALHLGAEVFDVIGGAGILQVIERAAIGDGDLRCAASCSGVTRKPEP